MGVPAGAVYRRTALWPESYSALGQSATVPACPRILYGVLWVVNPSPKVLPRLKLEAKKVGWGSRGLAPPCRGRLHLVPIDTRLVQLHGWGSVCSC